ncbi:MAG: site-specific DNA-methyltransferase, partial [Deltaproteobacteria bacterium]|nr:site-specific DNA-methyltransferase [Deltaproteobacteria bacterium]
MGIKDYDKEKIISLLQEGKSLPEVYKQKLFPTGDKEYAELTKVYQLLYQGKKRREDIIAETLEAPLQEIRTFNTENAFSDGWRNMLIFGDNLMALKAIYEDQRGPDKYGTRNRIKLIYIDPPFSTRQDFMKDREKAYRDKIIGTQFIEFLRKRLVLLKEVLAEDGSLYVHLDYKKSHY